MKLILCDFWWYWLIAAAYSIFQGYRGFIIQVQLAEQGTIDLSIQKVLNKIKNKADNDFTEEQVDELSKLLDKKIVYYAKTTGQAICLRAIPYSFFYFVTTLLGFIALFSVYYILNNTCDLNDISGGTSALLIFAVLYGIIGITGQLPSLIEKGNLPK